MIVLMTPKIVMRMCDDSLAPRAVSVAPKTTCDRRRVLLNEAMKAWDQLAVDWARVARL